MIFEHPEFDGHEAIHFIHDRQSGLRAIVALHDTTLGSAFGGCRAYAYDSDEAALRDVLRLSRGMTYKNAAAGVPHGGGKSVILTNGTAPTEAQRLAFAQALSRLGGDYITAEDVGTSTADVAVMARATPHVRNLPLDNGGRPAPFTAWGVFSGIEAGWRHVAGADLVGAVIAVEGLGAVGMELCRLVTEAGASLVVCDVDASRVDEAVAIYGAEAGQVGTLHAAKADIYAPCALGGTVTAATVPEIRAKLIAGGANNQLGTAAEGAALVARGITYCPDFIINAGGVLSVAAPGETFDPDAAFKRAGTVGARIRTVLDLAVERGIPTQDAAEALAREVITAGRKAAEVAA